MNLAHLVRRLRHPKNCNPSKAADYPVDIIEYRGERNYEASFVVDKVELIDGRIKIIISRGGGDLSGP